MNAKYLQIKALLTVSAVAICTATAGVTYAAESPEPAEKKRLHVAIGSGFIASPRPYVGAKPQFFPVPVLHLRYERWFLEGIRGGYALSQGEKLDARVFTQVRFRGLEPQSSPFLTGMEARKKSLDAGLELIYRGRPVGFRASALTDVLGRSNGQEVSLAAVTGAPLGKALVLVGFGPRWLSNNRVDYYYGVRSTEAQSGRPGYTGSSTVNWDLSITTIYELSPRWNAFWLVTREALGSGIRKSPLVERSSAYSLVASVTYSF
ncbi:MAG TPA: MipA/OmpV family protein [Vicinamibacteria bacterium]|nr:MipA/OmpV family protein [Vicinamibacteria bacterium]